MHYQDLETIKQIILDYEQKNPLALYPTSSYRNSSGHVVSSNDYQQIEATMNLNTFTSIKVEEDTLNIKNPLLRDNYKSFGRCICLVDQNIEENYGQEIDNYFNHNKIILEKLIYRAMEVDKHIKNVEKIVEDFRRLGVNRNEPILIIGGGRYRSFCCIYLSSKHSIYNVVNICCKRNRQWTKSKVVL